MITGPAQAEKIVGTGLADLIFIGRAFLDDPYWAWHAARKPGVEAVAEQRRLLGPGQ